MNNQEWLNSMYQAGLRAGMTDLQARVTASQAALESGWGRSGLSTRANNYFGMKAGKSWDGPTITMPTKEQAADGSWYTENARFRQYGSMEESLADKSAMMQRNWPDAMNAQTWDQAMAGLRNGRYGAYATDKNYASKLASINSKINPSGAYQNVAPQTVQAAQAPLPQPAANNAAAVTPATQAAIQAPGMTAVAAPAASGIGSLATQAASALPTVQPEVADPLGGLFGLMMQARMMSAAQPTQVDSTVPRPKVMDNRPAEQKIASVSQTPDVYEEMMRRRRSVRG